MSEDTKEVISICLSLLNPYFSNLQPKRIDFQRGQEELPLMLEIFQQHKENDLDKRVLQQVYQSLLT